ncbi:MAG: hypothetical protein ABGY21_13050, partial [Pseudomonadota bacterium]
AVVYSASYRDDCNLLGAMMETALEHLIGVTASKELDPIQVRFEPVLPVIHLNRDRWKDFSPVVYLVVMLLPHRRLIGCFMGAE